MEWVVWDTSYLTTFSSWVKNAIGSSTNIGILAFGIIVSILIVVTIIKRFVR